MIKKLVLNLDYRIMQKATHDFVLGRKNLSVERYEASYGISCAFDTHSESSCQTHKHNRQSSSCVLGRNNVLLVSTRTFGMGVETNKKMLKDSDKFFVPNRKCPAYQFTERGKLSFESPMQTPYEVNNIVYAQYYPSNPKSKSHFAGCRKAGKSIILVHHRGGNIEESLDEIKYLITWETSMNEFRIMMSQ